uniref:Uncharacterized protein n=1 Tax=Trichogramma kaykai TaxID=54128 RepID=A0ABD2W2A5_9HYME
MLQLADRRLRSYLRAAPTPPPSPERSAPALMQQTAAQPTGPSGSPPPVWRLIRLDTPPPPRTPRLGPSSLQSAIKRSADTTAANEIEREQLLYGLNVNVQAVYTFGKLEIACKTFTTRAFTSVT